MSLIVLYSFALFNSYNEALFCFIEAKLVGLYIYVNHHFIALLLPHIPINKYLCSLILLAIGNCNCADMALRKNTYICNNRIQITIKHPV